MNEIFEKYEYVVMEKYDEDKDHDRYTQDEWLVALMGVPFGLSFDDTWKLYEDHYEEFGCEFGPDAIADYLFEHYPIVVPNK